MTLRWHGASIRNQPYHITIAINVDTDISDVARDYEVYDTINNLSCVFVFRYV